MARPPGLADAPVAAWEGSLTLPTYDPAEPEWLPMYLDRRVYQGSSGRVYPLPFHHRIVDRSSPRRWRAVHLQNEWMHVVVLPELGGRIYAAQDRVTGGDIFWANPVVKPALVGLAGPWLAGGVEFNWPQHHRPATYLPTDWTINTCADGSAVIWCSDHEPASRMKGMHGVRLRPDSSRIEVEVRLYNRAETPQSFLWWANVAARVDEHYQSFFPHDVTVVADHAKRAVTAFPHADRPYYGIDYPARADDRSTAADGTSRSGDRLDWYRNIPVPTSYMCLDSREDFFGGYDHRTGLGFVHVADHQVAVGKKQWTWGNAAFGHAWEANLGDDGSHYIELMAGVFTDNQPDFSYLAPGETKVFSQSWYPLREIGPVDRASAEAAVRLRRVDGELLVGVVVTRRRSGLEIELSDGTGMRVCEAIDLDPGRAHQSRHPATHPTSRPAASADPVTVTVRHHGVVLVSWTEPDSGPGGPGLVEPATEPAPPEQVESVEELALTGEHLELYRHPTRDPEPYWEEALRRDGGHVAARTGLAVRALRAGRTTVAEGHLMAADRRLRRRHPNPQDTRVLYLIGLLREAQGRDAEAYDAYGRASWVRAWRGPAGYRMARVDARHGRYADALARLADVARVEPEHLQAAALEVVCRRRLGDPTAEPVLARARRLDPLDAWLRCLDGDLPSSDAQTCLDVALELSGVGETENALQVLRLAEERERHRPLGQTACLPLLWWHRADLLGRLGRTEQATAAAERAGRVDARWCFPGRLSDAAVLAAALARAVGADPAASLDDLTRLVPGVPRQPGAGTLLGLWAYGVGRHDEAAALWEAAATAVPEDVMAWRNLGMYRVNHRSDLEGGRHAYRAACAAAPEDPRLRYEQDQLAALAGVAPGDRLAAWCQHPALAAQRDDAAIEVAQLMISTGAAAAAVELLHSRVFQPWEGGEGQVLAAWERGHVHLAVSALADGRGSEAVEQLSAAPRPRCPRRDPAPAGRHGPAAPAARGRRGVGRAPRAGPGGLAAGCRPAR